MSDPAFIHVVGARQHNLKNIEVRIPRGQVTVITGVSGSGKSSLAFDTIYAEGRRRYVESLSVHARQFLEQMPPPDVDRIEGLSPTIAVEQRITATGPRSTVATATDIYDFLRVLFARVGRPHCWICDRPIIHETISEIVDTLLAGPAGLRFMILAPLVTDQRGAHADVLDRARKEGFLRARIDGQIMQLEEMKPLSANKKHTIEMIVDRLTLKPDLAMRLADSLETAARLGAGRIVVSSETAPDQWTDRAFGTVLACPEHPEVRIESLSPQLFSFNSPHGACPECHGLGITMDFDLDLVVPDRNRSLIEGAVAAFRHQGKALNERYSQLIAEFCERFQVSDTIAFKTISEDKTRILLHGTSEEDAKQFGASFEGVLADLRRRWQTTESESAKQRLYEFLSETPCTACHGARLRKEAMCVRVADRPHAVGRNLAEVTAMTVAAARDFFSSLRFAGDAQAIAEPILHGISHRLEFLMECGVAYLTLDRRASTLSGGEWQRIRLATHIGGGLSGVCYVLDEPTIGLHPRDNQRLSEILRRLAAAGNTVIVVEHDPQIIAHADYFIEIGPGAGAHGGQVVVSGPREETLRDEASLTAQYITGKLSVPVPELQRKPDAGRRIMLEGVKANNLKNIRAVFPLGCFVCVTGVSGSGKSTLVHDVLLRALRRHLDRGGAKPMALDSLRGAELVTEVIEVDQSPIGKTPRSNPATYVGVFSLVRELFAMTREAKIRGYGPQRFSFNVKGGRCEHCQGQGTRRIAMHFLPDVYVPCGHCGGKRYNRETLEIRYRGKSIADVLDLRVEDAAQLFENIPRIHKRLHCLQEVGLGYITLGQASNTLSGGEAQRVKLAAQLHRAGEGHTVYVLDEPTTGLHFADVGNLLAVLQRIVDRGHTVIVIEHNLDVIRSADWIIDLGPEAGDEGGRIVAEGTPEQIAAAPESRTGESLRQEFHAAPRLSAWADNSLE